MALYDNLSQQYSGFTDPFGRREEEEDAVVTADDLMFIEFNRIFDAYMRELRNMLGEQFLH